MLTLILIALISAATTSAAGPKLTTLIAEAQVANWRCEDQLGYQRTRASVAPWALPRSAAYRQWVLARWTKRKHTCVRALAEVKRQWNWQAWLPDKWRRVGVCETGLNWQHGNSDYVSAFGIQRGAFDGAYDHDAARVGMPPWSDRRPPSPWQQYMTALSHYAHHHGFSGWGCGGA